MKIRIEDDGTEYLADLILRTMLGHQLLWRDQFSLSMSKEMHQKMIDSNLIDPVDLFYGGKQIVIEEGEAASEQKRT